MSPITIAVIAGAIFLIIFSIVATREKGDK